MKTKKVFYNDVINNSNISKYNINTHIHHIYTHKYRNMVNEVLS